MSIMNVNQSARELVLGRYYPLTSDEANTLIRAGRGSDLINFVSDGPYSYLREVMI